MRFVILCLTLIVCLYSCNDGEHNTEVQRPLKKSKYSSFFNGEIGNVLNDYYALSEALVKWDSVDAAVKAANLVKTLDNTSFEELKKDTVVFQSLTALIPNIKNDLSTIMIEQDLTVKRQSFNNVTQNLYDLLRAIQYDDAKIYLNECTMPYNNGGSGLWLSSSDTLRNPYLGLYHPKYKKGMLDCGLTRDSVNFISSR